MGRSTHSFASLLTAEQVQRIHEASLEILQRVGLEVHNRKAREIFKRHGCPADEMRVTIPSELVEESIRAIPPRFTFRAQNPEHDRTVPDERPLVITASSAPNLIDPTTGTERPATSQDLARIACLVDQLPGIDLFSVTTLADDAPSGQHSLTRFYTALKHCRKPVRGSGDPAREIESILELAYAIAGGEEAYREHPFITHHYCPVISPLKMDDRSTGRMIFYTEQGFPGHPTIVPNAGLTSPLTLVGTVAQGNAEFLATATLTQMIRPGTPTLYSSLPTVCDMRSGAYASGGVECGMLNMAHAQMARHYGLASSGYIGLTNSKLVDAQAGYEKALSSIGGLLAGMDVLQFAGLIDALKAFDYSMLVIDNEISLMLKRVARGLEFSEDNLSLDEVAEVGPGGSFITTAETLARTRETALFPEVADRDHRQSWMASGGRDAAARALVRAKELLEGDHPTTFSPEVDARIRRRFEGLVSGDLTVPDGW